MAASEASLRRLVLSTVPLLTLLLALAGSAIAASLLYREALIPDSSGEAIASYLILAIVVFAVVFGIVYVAKTTTPWKAVAFGFLSILLAGGCFALSWWLTSQPSYVVEDYIGTVTVGDVLAREGHLNIRKDILATRGGFTELLLPSLGAEGDVVTFNIDIPNREFRLEKTKTAGVWHGRIILPRSIKAGDRLTVEANIATIDESATRVKPDEPVYGHALIWENVKRLELGIVAPSQRPCRSGKGWSIDAAGSKDRIALPRPRGTELVLVIDQPRRGWQYVIECTLTDTVLAP